IEERAEFFNSNHIKPLAFNALVFFNNRDKDGHKAIIAEFKKMMIMAEKLGVKYVVAVPLVTEGKKLKEAIKHSGVEGLAELSDIAEPYGVK
ncbi:UNVERIFIED_CONTAM: TIM barrel protein, partial [Bacillus sp. ATCC 13368]